MVLRSETESASAVRNTETGGLNHSQSNLLTPVSTPAALPSVATSAVAQTIPAGTSNQVPPQVARTASVVDIDTEVPPFVILSVETVALRKAAADERTELADEVKTQLTKHFQRANDLLTQKAEVDKRAADLKAERENAPALIAEARNLAGQPPPKSEPEFPESATVADLEQLRLNEEGRAAEARRALETWESKAKVRSERKPQMPALIETTRKQLEDAEKAFAGPGPEGELPVVAIARRTEQEAAAMLLKSQLEL
ncbi:MAG: hypothetical protein KDA89_25650, partial [Planctomycetaceae bacterium]|nr:hypothetical protein [Planctomycetaceae bacterium]